MTDSELREGYELNFLRNGLIIALLITALLVGANYFLLNNCINNAIPTIKKDLYPLIATTSGTLLGYILTGLSILLVFPESEKIKKLIKGGYYKIINRTYVSAIIWLATTTIVSMIGVLSINDLITLLIFYPIVFLALISIIRITRCIWILYKIVDIIVDGKTTDKKSEAHQPNKLFDQ